MMMTATKLTHSSTIWMVSNATNTDQFSPTIDWQNCWWCNTQSNTQANRYHFFVVAQVLVDTRPTTRCIKRSRRRSNSNRNRMATFYSLNNCNNRFDPWLPYHWMSFYHHIFFKVTILSLSPSLSPFPTILFHFALNGKANVILSQTIDSLITLCTFAFLSCRYANKKNENQW